MSYIDDGRLLLCDPVKQEIKQLKFKCDEWCAGVFVYKESLVSIQDEEHVEAQLRRLQETCQSGLGSLSL